MRMYSVHHFHSYFMEYYYSITLFVLRLPFNNGGTFIKYVLNSMKRCFLYIFSHYFAHVFDRALSFFSYIVVISKGTNWQCIHKSWILCTGTCGKVKQ